MVLKAARHHWDTSCFRSAVLLHVDVKQEEDVARAPPERLSKHRHARPPELDSDDDDDDGGRGDRDLGDAEDVNSDKVEPLDDDRHILVSTDVCSA